MFALAATRLGVKVLVLDPTDQAPASVAATQVSGSFRDSKSILDFAKQVDVMTVEIEHINTAALQEAVDAGCDVQPQPATLKIIQDKYNQKRYLEQHGIPLPPFTKVDGEKDIDAVSEKLGFPLMLKSRYLAYDGRGNYVVNNKEDFVKGIKCLTENASEVDKEEILYAEGWAPFTKELAVMVARDREGKVITYPVVETNHEDSILAHLECPADVPLNVQDRARQVAKEAVSKFEGAGVFGVELFLLEDGSVLLNEIAPRPHNSGHYTIEACVTSQYENHVRAVLGWPLGDTSMICGGSTMINILGEASGSEGAEIANSVISRSLCIPGAYPHWYGKEGVKPGRKIGHVTFTASTLQAARSKRDQILKGKTQALTETGEEGEAAKAPEVAVIMGSDSDLYVMKDAAEILRDFGIATQVTVVSAHRTPERMFDFARNAHKRGIKVIIAGAGGAAHLPGMVASMTPLPVIGVPVIPKGAALDGMDSLLSIVQMPRGIPVATVAIQNATNAGLLAARIIGSANPAVLDRMQSYQDGLKDMVEKKAARLEGEGWEKYETP
jgi:phosphoribosylaminoimidazole carboxylase